MTLRSSDLRGLGRLTHMNPARKQATYTDLLQGSRAFCGGRLIGRAH